MNPFKNKRRIALVAIDVAILASVYFVAFILESLASGISLSEFLKYVFSFCLFLPVLFIVRSLFRVYSHVWRYANSRAYLDTVVSDMVGGAIAVLVSYFIGVRVHIGYWQNIAIVGLFDCATLASRFIYQQLHKSAQLQSDSAYKDNKITVAIVGAGRVGALLAEELLCFKNSHYRPVCFIDHSKDKVGSRVAGLPVFADDETCFDKLASYPVQEIIIAIPQLSGEKASDFFAFYGRTGCKIKLYDFPTKDNVEEENDSAKRVIREFKIEDLLFRSAIKVVDSDTVGFYKGKTILVTGGGGSIGSELSRQIARCQPKRLIIFDIYENNVYDIQQELIMKYKDKLNLSVEIGSVRDRARLDAVFAFYRPDIVFHAAAHKHVPLMEHSNCEAIKNNVLGTYNTADMAEKYGVKKFILISTDKAVNPTNVMGASKRLCEMVVQCRTDSATAFSAVRFGNVLGSNGSVIPLFKRQIARGGPITLTDKRIIRYFMTIPEASGLVMQAGAMAKCGELFVLDMGKPIRIYDLAENMIKLSGLVPGEDIKIVETGLRPGEKLYEELLIKTENLKKTDNNLIFIEHDAPLTRSDVDAKLDILCATVKENEGAIASDAITLAMRRVVPTFLTPEEVNRNAQNSDEMKEADTIA